MKKELYGITREDAADKNSYILEYYLIEQEIASEDTLRRGYGVEIKKIIPSVGRTIEETGSVCDVFANRGRAEQFIRLLTDCKVTPVHLKDITIDFMNAENDVLCTA